MKFINSPCFKRLCKLSDYSPLYNPIYPANKKFLHTKNSQIENQIQQLKLTIEQSKRDHYKFRDKKGQWTKDAIQLYGGSALATAEIFAAFIFFGTIIGIVIYSIDTNDIKSKFKIVQQNARTKFNQLKDSITNDSQTKSASSINSSAINKNDASCTQKYDMKVIP